MKKKLGWILVTVIVAAVAFSLGPVLWPASAGEGGPTGLQLPFFIAISALESVAFGLGIAFLLFGWPWVQCVAQGSKKMAVALYLSIAWQLVSWWPHDNMHISNAADD